MASSLWFRPILISAVCASFVAGFVQPSSIFFGYTAAVAQLTHELTINEQYSSATTQLWARKDDDEQNVRVDLVEDVDSVTLTAVGFALIAFNFLVLANLGDGGIAGFVATIINTLNQ